MSIMLAPKEYMCLKPYTKILKSLEYIFLMILFTVTWENEYVRKHLIHPILGIEDI